MKITNTYLEELGFKHKYNSSLKKIKRDRLFYEINYSQDTIKIEVQFYENKNEWLVTHILFTGKISFDILKQELNGSLKLEDVIAFIKKHPPM